MARCSICKSEFTKKLPLQRVCDLSCAKSFALEKKAKVDRLLIKNRREALKTKSDYLKEAQRAFNAFIRERDKNKPCICCGLPLFSGSIGGLFDCGHYRSVGSAPHLRFNPQNAHGQRKQCNRWGAGRAVDYRLGLISRIGLVEVELLESNQEPAHWTIEELKVIKKTYAQMARELKKGFA